MIRINKSLRNVRDAASVLVLRQHPRITSKFFDYEILLMKRHAKQKFMPNSYVFPGGSIDQADLDREKWQKVFRESYSEKRLRKLGQDLVYPVVPEMYGTLSEQEQKGISPKNQIFSNSKNSSPLDKSLMTNQILYRVAAIRELLEETGVFVSTEGLKQVDPSDRTIIHNDASKFSEYCLEFDLRPDISRLKEWSIWLTPTGLDSRRRFDTMFYILLLNEEESVDNNQLFNDQSHDNIELTNTTWAAPHTFLHNYKKFLMHPPQTFELARLCNFKHYSDLISYSETRDRLFGTERWMPVVFPVEDQKTKEKANMTILPGDFLYPAKKLKDFPKYYHENFEPRQIFDQSLGEIYSRSNQLEIWRKRKYFPGYLVGESNIKTNNSQSNSSKNVLKIGGSKLSEYDTNLKMMRGYWFSDKQSAINPEMSSEKILWLSNYGKHCGNYQTLTKPEQRLGCGQIAPLGPEDWPEEDLA